MVDLSKMTKWDMGKLFDFSVLPKQSTEADIRRGCQIAKEYNCKAFCFSSSEWTPIVAEELKGTDIMVGAAIGFPFGQQSSAVKAFETAEAAEKNWGMGTKETGTLVNYFSEGLTLRAT